MLKSKTVSAKNLETFFCAVPDKCSLNRSSSSKIKSDIPKSPPNIPISKLKQQGLKN